MDGFRSSRCHAISVDCRNEPDCATSCAGKACWSTKDAACCRRNDKSRCCYCSVYLSFLVLVETGSLVRTRQESYENESFVRMSKAADARVKSGEFCEASW
jgi:hypothetical protein